MEKLGVKNIFIDLDGTALKSDKTISAETINTIKQLKAKKINVFVATGRPPYMIKKELEQLNVNKNVVCVNGGMIVNYKNDEILHITKFDDEVSWTIETFLKLNKIPYLIYTDKAIYYNCADNNKWVSDLFDRVQNVEDQYKWNILKINHSFQLENHRIVKFIIPIANLVQEMINKLYALFEQNSNLFTLLKSQDDILDIIPCNVSKGDGINYIAEKLSLNLDKTLAFGDAENDIPMFEAVKYSVALENAVDNLKRIATFVTKENNNKDAISKFVKKHIL